jgi:hypothetical protein
MMILPLFLFQQRCMLPEQHAFFPPTPVAGKLRTSIKEPEMGIVKIVAAAVFVGWCGIASAADAVKDEAMARLAASHEPDVPQSVGRLAAKQAGLRAVRAMLPARGKTAQLDRGWNIKAPEWQQAEAHFAGIIDAVIGERIEDGAWVHNIIAEKAASVLSASEADEITRHFATANGNEQRKVVEIKVLGELLQTTYTFTDRINDRFPGSERELLLMQNAWAAREPFKARNFDGDEGAARFGTRDPGVKYVKALAFRGVEGMLAHIDAACSEVVAAVTSHAPEADPFIETYRNRTAK